MELGGGEESFIISIRWVQPLDSLYLQDFVILTVGRCCCAVFRFGIAEIILLFYCYNGHYS